MPITGVRSGCENLPEEAALERRADRGHWVQTIGLFLDELENVEADDLPRPIDLRTVIIAVIDGSAGPHPGAGAGLMKFAYGAAFGLAPKGERHRPSPLAIRPGSQDWLNISRVSLY